MNNSAFVRFLGLSLGAGVFYTIPQPNHREDIQRSQNMSGVFMANREVDMEAE